MIESSINFDVSTTCALCLRLMILLASSELATSIPYRMSLFSVEGNLAVVEMSWYLSFLVSIVFTGTSNDLNRFCCSVKMRSESKLSGARSPLFAAFMWLWTKFAFSSAMSCRYSFCCWTSTCRASALLFCELYVGLGESSVARKWRRFRLLLVSRVPAVGDG